MTLSQTGLFYNPARFYRDEVNNYNSPLHFTAVFGYFRIDPVTFVLLI